jgi:VanZ family protein
MRLAMVWLASWALFSFPWTSATSTPHWDRVEGPRVRWTSRIKPDHVLNLLFYLPAAPLGSTLGWSLPIGVLAASVLSLTAEAVQVFSVDRSPDGNDLVANIAGAIIGALVMVIYRRRSSRDGR